MPKKEDYILFSGAAKGAEAEFGAVAENFGIDEVNYTFEGHENFRTRGIRVLNHEELNNGDFSLTYVSKIMNRQYPMTDTFRKILQTIFYQINSSRQIYVIGKIQDNNTVKGGTGWGAEFAKICHKPLHVFDQDKENWFRWNKEEWIVEPQPVITDIHFCGTGTRHLTDAGKKAIFDLFDRTFNS